MQCLKMLTKLLIKLAHSPPSLSAVMAQIVANAFCVQTVRSEHPPTEAQSLQRSYDARPYTSTIDRLPRVVGNESSAHIWGTRSRPYYLPPSTAQTYGAPIRTDLSTTARLARRDPAEFLNRTRPGTMESMVQAEHDNKHAMVQREYTDNKPTTQRLAGTLGPSGFVRNVDTFRAPQRQQSDFGSFQTSYHAEVSSHAQARPTSTNTGNIMPTAQNNFSRSTGTHRFNFASQTARDMQTQRPEVLARLRKTNPFMFERDGMTTSRQGWSL
eukprot:TRINITY_DN12558_c11_g1_i2.p1 TRINITY_DN12558_c11_g1~~TRINITY_DN12558_c11_g1_i2.p1  ORF type:complete len:270 (+),score=43.43 TRINITY_DN12558_c11_g1_i2:135-944(+)